jgi:hypothetical protein
VSGVVLPLRYHTRWRQPYEDQISARLRDGMTILDIGAGRHPTLDADARPPRTTYVGLDISGDEMRAAGPNAYDEMQAADITSLVPTLVDSVDLAVSWQVFEHVKAMDGHRIVERVMSRHAQNVPVFPAYYHRCSARQLRKMTVAWRSVEIVPLFRGATYFNFSTALTRMYLRYEEQARRRRADNLATHYLLIARK